MSSLGCVISFSRYLVLKLVISALTVGICRSVCKTVFGTSRWALGWFCILVVYFIMTASIFFL